MRTHFFYLLFIFAVISPPEGHTAFNSSSLPQEVKRQLQQDQKLSETQIDELWKGEILSQVKVKTKQNTQNLDLWVSAFHPQNCRKALRKISHYEGYDEFLSFIKSSEYDDKTQRWKIKLDHVLMPFPMYLDFKMPRVKKEGNYPFTFKKGFLSGLLGEVKAQETASRCQLTLTSKWSGPKTKIPDIVFSSFVQTLAELGLRHLIRSSTL
ncbi:MAG: hypothetical protein WDA09_06310 [Bacteriovoracaceae bacterium]